MRFLSITLLSILLAPGLSAEPLTQSDREALLTKLERLQDASDAKVAERFKVAVRAFRTAAASETAAIELYLKCIEKIEFDDEYRKSQEFREWKRKEADRLKSQGFKLALRHQLRWLILTLQAASPSAADTNFAGQAAQYVDDLFADLPQMEGQERTLQQSVMGTIFAQAYKLTDVKVENWPMTPANVGEVYDKIVMPPLRMPSRTDDLRAAWQRRIKLETEAQEQWTARRREERGEDRRIGTKEALRAPEFEKFLAETYPDLLWQMEVDLYKAGDQRGAALRMFQHLEKYLAHPKVTDWMTDISTLLNTADAEKPEPGDEVPETEEAPSS